MTLHREENFMTKSAAKQGFTVPYKSPHPTQAKKDSAQNARHNADMQKIERMHLRGQK
jgi:cbb3-type cytochrome oxidase cytochrome c subunit